MADRSEDWFNQSRRDLDSARAQRDSGFHEWACFIAQQSSEKALKAVFQRFGGEVRGHSLVELFNALQERVEIPGQLRRSAVHLDRYYIPSRYPNGWASGSPADYFTEEDADGAICHSQKIVRFCHGILAGPGLAQEPDSGGGSGVGPGA